MNTVKRSAAIVTAIVYCAMASSNVLAQNVCDETVLVGITRENRQDISYLLKKVQDAEPRVIAIDIIFSGDDESNSKLRKRFIQLNPPIITATRLSDHGDGTVYLVGSDPTVVPFECQTGFNNIITKDDFLETAEQFQMWSSTDINPDREYHLAVRIAMNLDSAKTNHFIKSNSDTTTIDYHNGKKSFKSISMDDLLNETVPIKGLKGKVLIIGYIDPELRLAVPVLNKRTGVRMRMDRIEILANIVAQILGE
jgi:CHASE2 domain-containing sensor protein